MVIEVVTFHLKDNADEAAFLAADARVQTEFIPNHHGFLRRTTARGADGEWAVVVLWYSDVDAEASMQMWDSHPVTRHFMSFVDPTSLVVRRYESLD